MRLVAVLASVAIAFAAATLPASLVETVGHTDAGWSAASSDATHHDGTPLDATTSETEDDDLDERDDDLETLGALPTLALHTWSPHVGDASWPFAETSAPADPHLDRTLRPPIAA